MWHEINYIWIAYFWPSLKSNGPEALIQVAAGMAVATALWPVARKVFRNEVKRAHTEMTGVEHELERVLPDVRNIWKKVHHG